MDSFSPLFPVIGLISGVLAGLLGIGGGLIIVPALLFLLPYHGYTAATAPPIAVATSLATVIITSIAAVYGHHRRGAVRWAVAARMGLGLAAGALAGAWVVDRLPGPLLRTGYGVFALAVALLMVAPLRPPSGKRLPGTGWLAGTGVVIGHISALVGIGGGTLTVPYLHWRGVPMREAVATSSACGLAIALGATLGFSLVHPDWGGDTAGYIHWSAALGIGFASMLTAPLGVRLAHRISTAALTRVFAFFLAVVGIRLLIT